MSAALGGALLTLALAGAVVGSLTRRELVTFGYRIDGDEPRGDRWAGWVSWWPVVVLAALWPAVAATVGARYGWEAVPAYLLLGWLSVALVWIDADVHRLPNGLTYPAYPALAVLLVAASVALGDSRWLGSLVGMVAVFGLFAVLSILSRGQLGLGDVKWSGVIGLALGWLGVDAVLIGLMATFLVGGVWALALLLSRRATGKTMLAYGPAMCIGAFLAILSGARVLDVVV
ncbi:MAG: prepilin peptidase [Intrasporangiaceae bacterium]|nr:prepilin peptidase [Intrasporangiaceae bacterium]